MMSYWSLDEYGTVNSFADLFSGLDGFTTDSTRPVQDSGVVNQCRKFNGNSEITVPENPLFDWGEDSSFSIEVWIKTTQPGTGNKVFIGKYKGDSNMLWWLGYGGQNKIVFSVNDSSGKGGTLTGSKIITDGKWHFIAAVENNSMHILQVYVDGKDNGKLTTSFDGDFKGTGPVYIGYFYNGYHFSGDLDEIALYNRSLTQNEIMQHYQNGLNGKSYFDSVATGIKDISNNVPVSFKLEQNYPNPFNPETKIDFSLAEPAKVKLNIYNVLGQRVKSLLNSYLDAGFHSIFFDGSNLPSGTYIYRLQAGNYIQSRKMILLK